ncbi:MAG: DNA polymerase III subunit gamma and tau [Nocardioidaceae bacterium]|nr:DNA polymerase III subunit gamma and tau [Nocardioidaceae bacterium]MCL2613230.1 DNA polymerase III subunit gamma and tau [Nocardioidaceae bacterium]
MDSPLALYRRYRPETFGEVIGQEHVTEPLRAALAANRVNHAYLFSGPRGCGKTTSARILARALNCERAPIADPCGECESCRDLARGGPGSIDVIEIDAASHGGVDDARDLREKAFFAPVRSRYKVYIIDEAHMVTTQGFNALLKLVEEPPPHLRFIFATTEPDKVIPTIRSRTHHYPFRLIPPRLLSSYLSELCEREGVAIEPAALPLVVRAGAGSARDTLSVLDQLLGGAGPAGVTYQLASGLLGYTPDTLLDDVVDAFAAGDGGAVFGVVDKVIETGQDPRRFTEDLLRRLRDLVIIAAVPDAHATGLIDVADDQAERLVAQANRFGRADLVRAADLVATGLTDMRGATAPRLLLELICARVLLPGADHSTEGVMARLDRLERRVSIGGGAPAPTIAPRVEPVPAQDRPEPATAERSAPERQEPARETEPPAAVEPERVPEPSAPLAPPEPAAPPEQAAAAAPAAPAASAPSSGGLTLVDVRRLWPDVIDRARSARKLTWIHLTQNSQVVGFDDDTITLGFTNAGARTSFENGHNDVVRQLVIDVIGADVRIETVVDPGADPGAGPPPSAPAQQARPVPPEQPRQPEPPRASEPASEPPPWAVDEPGDGPPQEQSRRAMVEQYQAQDEEPPEDPDAAVSLNDTDVDAESGPDLLARELGAQMIEEIPRS